MIARLRRALERLTPSDEATRILSDVKFPCC
ncbi:hypothetical protein SAMN05444340_11351 [Citreimonas salinaria]|uniref:Uncharacterized protein n=1 Tax=Citreimonas salinaria TaxID=321339 RepID=A0A1H3LJ42_9RHOB|nr:hypothetical protein SAMN05444340_11351 [Citreimonas salinaria]